MLRGKLVEHALDGPRYRDTVMHGHERADLGRVTDAGRCRSIEPTKPQRNFHSLDTSAPWRAEKCGLTPWHPTLQDEGQHEPDDGEIDQWGPALPGDQQPVDQGHTRDQADDRAGHIEPGAPAEMRYAAHDPRENPEIESTTGAPVEERR